MDIPYYTWANTSTATSPDHILVSKRRQQFITSATVSETTAINHGLDHNLVTVGIDMGKIHVPKQDRRPKTQRVTRKTQKAFIQTVEEETQHLTYSRDTVKHFFLSLPQLSTQATPHRTPNVSQKTFKISNIRNNIKILNKVKYHLMTATPMPDYLKQRQTVQSLPELSIPAVTDKIKALKAQYNSKGRKRNRVINSIYQSQRSAHFNKSRLGKFLKSAFSRYSDFTGVIGRYNEDKTQIHTDPEGVKKLATDRTIATYFTLTKQVPDYFRGAERHHRDWLSLPQWFQEMFHNVRQHESDPIYNHIMDDVNLPELNRVLAHMGKNKSPGGTLITVEHLHYLSDEQKQKWLIPYLNDCLSDKDIPRYTKPFNIWNTEKSPGTGSIMHPTEKLNVRPICLLEIPAKLVEAVITHRLQTTMLKHGKLSALQFGFTPGKKVSDILLIYMFLLEDAKDKQKLLFLANTDASRAYDSIAPWVTEAIYAYHKFPPTLAALLLNMDKDRMGTVITGHGPGEAKEKTCGLGQGSIISPLKWNLVLQPLLEKLNTTEDPYTIGTGEHKVELRALAFADDLSIMASTQKGYEIRMHWADKYLSFIGVEFSAAKTKLTYTGEEHIRATKITSYTAQGEAVMTETAVASPYEAMRYLGGYLSPQCDFKEAKEKLMHDLTAEIDKLKYKKLHWKEVRYAIQAVIQAKYRYYSLVVPLSRTEIKTLDNKIAQIARASLGMAKSSTSHVLYMPENGPAGFSFPSLMDTEAVQLLTTAHDILNESHSIVHNIAHARLQAYRDHINWTENPLDDPETVPKGANGETRYQKEHWFSRVAAAATYLKSPIRDQEKTLSTAHRANDTPLHQALEPHVYVDILGHLRAHNLRWVGDIADSTGTRIIPPHLLGIRKHHNSIAPPEWWAKLHEQVTTAQTTNKLKYPVSPTATSLPHRRLILRQGDMVMTPGAPVNIQDPLGKVKEHKYIQITKVSMVGDREHFWGRELIPHTTRCTHIEQTPGQPRREVLMQGLNPLKIPPSHTTAKRRKQAVDPYELHDDAKNVAKISGTWTNIGQQSGKLTTVFLPTEDHSITTAYATTQGLMSPHRIQELTEEILSRCYVGDDGQIYSDTDTEEDNQQCQICNLQVHPIHQLRCHQNNRCTGIYHRQCIKTHTELQEQWSCQRCIKPEAWHPTPRKLNPTLQRYLRTRDSPIYVASDGSVKGAQTGQARSSWGPAISTGGEIVFSACGAIEIRQTEESSLRSEIQGLIYRTIQTTTNRAKPNSGSGQHSSYPNPRQTF
jgi:hypothetical protein